ncbi:MAG: TrkA family potassium uptake protein [Clostridia bacterium]|nr:TrkA family potassium uptake protein [Clostridia bacterium]
MKSYAVIGLGRFGSSIARSLYEYGEEVIAVDIHEELVNAISDHVTRAVTADCTNKDELRFLGIQDCDCVIIALGTNFSASILVTMNVISLNAKYVICKAHDNTHREILTKLGADKVIIPEREAAEKTARMLTSPDFLEYLDLSDEYGIIEIDPPKMWIGKEIIDLGIRRKHNVNVIAIKVDKRTIISIPPRYVIPKECKLVLLGDYDDLNDVKKLKR